jgi:hypothetical protein
MIHHNILMMISSHILGVMIHILLSTWGYFFEEDVQPPLCSDFGEHSLDEFYGAVIFMELHELI